MFTPTRNRHPMLPLLATMVLAAPLACDPGDVPGEGAVQGPPPVAEAVTDSATMGAVAQTAGPVAGALLQSLSGRLQTAIQEEGVVGAMEFCNVEALPLTAQVAEEQGLAVKRTSVRLRNPENAPDEAEAAALTWFAERIWADGRAPDFHVQRLADGAYRYYQPLATAAFCLQCHGTPEALAPGVAEALEALYPEDEATGYTEGEWRGVIRVTVPADALLTR